MPRLVNKLPKYSLHKPSGQAKVRFNGKDTYLGRYGSPESKEAYAEFVGSMQARGFPQAAATGAWCRVDGRRVRGVVPRAHAGLLHTRRCADWRAHHDTVRAPSPDDPVPRTAGYRVRTKTADEIDWTDQSCWVYRPGHHKTAHKDKTRVIFIGAQAQEIVLRRFVKTARGERLFPMTRAALRRVRRRRLL